MYIKNEQGKGGFLRKPLVEILIFYPFMEAQAKLGKSALNIIRFDRD